MAHCLVMNTLSTSSIRCMRAAPSGNAVPSVGSSYRSNRRRSLTTQRSRYHVVSVSGAAVAADAGELKSPFAERDARLVLEDGSIFHGVGFGAIGRKQDASSSAKTRTAEVVFNTSLTGYQEIMSDPSYKGQFVVFTNPHIGNVGTNDDDMESAVCHMEGIVVRSLSKAVSNYRSKESLDDFCRRHGLVGIADVDTRMITMRVREKGALVGVVCGDDSVSDAELVERAQSWSIEGKDLINEVTTENSYEWKQGTDSEWEFSDNAVTPSEDTGKRFKVTAIDFGIKTNILRRLTSYGCDVTVMPASVTADEVKATNPDGIFLSNGPGDPSAVPYAVETVTDLIGYKPIFGICMGHQILSQALGAKTFKLKFGHHGGNHPVRREGTGRVEISAQNHNYAVDTSTLPPGVEISHINLNDQTCSGIRYSSKSAMGIQYHPESSPGPHDADLCFDDFMTMMKDFEMST